MYAESNVTSCICHGLGICTLTNPSVRDVRLQITSHALGSMKDTGSHINLRMHSMPTFHTLSIMILLLLLYLQYMYMYITDDVYGFYVKKCLVFCPGPSFKVTKKKKGLSVNSEQVVHEYIEVLCPLLVLAAQKFFESLLRKHQRVSCCVVA